MGRVILVLAFAILSSCLLNDEASQPSPQSSLHHTDSLSSVGDIPPPKDFKRVAVAEYSFGAWLRNISLKKDRHVYLYNGDLKRNQNAQFVVLNISVGHKDLQQCADALMRLRAEYLFSEKRYSEIEFKDNSGRSYKWSGGSNRSTFDNYLEKVFGMCGSASLEKQLHSVHSLRDMQPGDVFIRGGFPGHAMMVMDIAVNEKGRKMFLLAQSYMPAQDIHIVKNPGDDTLSPWYEVNEQSEIVTPEWTFFNNQLRRW